MHIVKTAARTLAQVSLPLAFTALCAYVFLANGGHLAWPVLVWAGVSFATVAVMNDNDQAEEGGEPRLERDTC